MKLTRNNETMRLLAIGREVHATRLQAGKLIAASVKRHATATEAWRQVVEVAETLQGDGWTVERVDSVILRRGDEWVEFYGMGSKYLVQEPDGGGAGPVACFAGVVVNLLNDGYEVKL